MVTKRCMVISGLSVPSRSHAESGSSVQVHLAKVQMPPSDRKSIHVAYYTLEECYLGLASLLTVETLTCEDCGKRGREEGRAEV